MKKGFIDNSTGVILAGGENTRMPILKAFIKVNGEPIIERGFNILKRLFQEVIIVTNQPELYVHLDVKLLGDVYDLRGPMTGILTALMNASNEWVFIIACDMPFINEDVIRYMALKRDGYVAVLTKSDPLFAFYSKRLLNPMERSLLAGKKGINDFLNGKMVRYIRLSEIKKIRDGERSFINLNTPSDVARYLGYRVRFKTERGKEG